MVTLEEAKNHCRIELETADFDGELQIALDAAVDHLKSLNVDMDAVPFPPALKQAVLMLVAHFFENKEAATPEKIWFTPIGVDRLIAPYRRVSL